MPTSSLVRKYYLIPEESLALKRDKAFLRKINNNSPGWEKEAFEILISDNKTDKKEILRRFLKENDPDAPDAEYHSVLNILPKNARHKARGLLYYILKIADIDENGLLVYKKGGMKGQTGGSLLDALKYLVYPRVNVVPEDILSLAELLYEMKTPLSLFGGPTKQPAHILSRLVKKKISTPEPEQKKPKWESVF